jgi:hypothetical protein
MGGKEKGLLWAKAPAQRRFPFGKHTPHLAPSLRYPPCLDLWCIPDHSKSLRLPKPPLAIILIEETGEEEGFTCSPRKGCEGPVLGNKRDSVLLCLASTGLCTIGRDLVLLLLLAATSGLIVGCGGFLLLLLLGTSGLLSRTGCSGCTGSGGGSRGGGGTGTHNASFSLGREACLRLGLGTLAELGADSTAKG